MSIALVLAIGVACLAAGAAAGRFAPRAALRRARERPRPVRRILLPFSGQAISRRAFEAAVRLARAENATIMPAFLVRVPMHMALDAAVPKQCLSGMPLLEAIEQRAGSLGVAVDARVARGRSYRDALRRLLEQEEFDRIIVSATGNARGGLSAEDIRWLLQRVPAEVLILRPAPDDTRSISGAVVSGHF